MTTATESFTKTRIVCQVIADQPNRLAITWSDGTGDFEPYYLTDLGDFQEKAQAARDSLSVLAQDWIDFPPAAPKIAQDALDLAPAGYALFKPLFHPAKDMLPRAKVVRKWLEEQRDADNVESLEIVVEAPYFVPWTVLYDREPDAQAFLTRQDTPERWLPFWGIRYNLCGGRRVNPLRRRTRWAVPRLLLVVDPGIRDGLPDEKAHRQRLLAYAAAQNVPLITSRKELVAALKDRRPYLMYWLSHAEPNALHLGDDLITPRDLKSLLEGEDDEDERPVLGLVFLNACRTGEGGQRGSFLDAVYAAGLTGLVATEQQTVNLFANTFGLDFLQRFLESRTPLGRLLRDLRQGGVPLGLLYTAFCPPNLYIDSPVSGVPASPELPAPQVTLPAGGQLLSVPGPVARERRPPPPLPDKPYRSLGPYGRADRALFAGREDDVDRFAALLDAPGTRLVVLHGETGVGKSSFLQAGVIPYLEEECVGYRACRSRTTPDAVEREHPLLVIRATNDLAGQIAQGFRDLCAHPYTFPRPVGQEMAILDLPNLLADFVQPLLPEGAPAVERPPTPQQVADAVRRDPTLPARLLSALGERLPYNLLLIIDQCEEVFTLVRPPEDEAGRERDLANRVLGLRILRYALETPGDFKIILGIRTEYHGRLITPLRRGLVQTASIREYLLTDFGEAELIEAIRRPTLDEPVPHASEVPFQKYHFRYDTGVPEQIARGALAFCTGKQDSVLPLVQVICTQLCDVARRRDGVVTAADLERLGGFKGGMRRHVEHLVKHLLPNGADQEALRRLFGRLYLRQPDGTLTTALVPAARVEKRWQRWKGKTPFDQMVQRAIGGDFRLLRVTPLRIGGPDATPYLSLGHDALAPVAARWDEEIRRSSRRRRLITWLVGLSVGVAVTVLCYLSLLSVQETIKEVRHELVDRTQDNNWFAARFAADTMGKAVLRRWSILKAEAEDKNLRRNLKRYGEVWDSPDEGGRLETEIRDWVQNRFRKYQTTTRATNWLLLDAHGDLLALSPPGDGSLLGKDFAKRDYFHGTGERQDSSQTRDKPIQVPHRSNVFLSAVDGKPLVAFSVPVREPEGDLAGQSEPRVLAVLVLTVEVGAFVELQSPVESGPQQQVQNKEGQILTLVDTRPNWNNQPGMILEHPALHGSRPPGHQFLKAEQLAKLGKLRDDEYEDPLGPSAKSKTWLAVFHPVEVKGHATELYVIVQDHPDDLDQSLDKIRHRIQFNGVLMLVLVALLVGAVVVFQLLRDKVARWLRRLRRKLGREKGWLAKLWPRRRTAPP